MPQRHPIDPKVDCVFKALLGSRSNQNLLIHFLNAVLGSELAEPVVSVTLLNPYNEREFLDDKLSIVDVKAQDQAGHYHQIEIQLLTRQSLAQRIVYGWTDLHSAQLEDGQDYVQLKPTYAIWLLGEKLWTDRDEAVHRFTLRDEQQRRLIPQGGIWVLELSKLEIVEVHSEQDRWLKFFIEGQRLSQAADLPEWMQTQEMQQAMQTVKRFSDKQQAYFAYQARQNYLRHERTQQKYLEAAQQQAEYERVEKERAQTALEQERAEKERLAARLRQLGIDPDE
jgi:predicted transposase/invertase (TIGR01784 family)